MRHKRFFTGGFVAVVATIALLASPTAALAAETSPITSTSVVAKTAPSGVRTLDDLPRVYAVADGFGSGLGAPGSQPGPTNPCGQASTSPVNILVYNGIIDVPAGYDKTCIGTTTASAVQLAASMPADVTDVILQVGRNDIGLDPLLACYKAGDCPDSESITVLNKARAMASTIQGMIGAFKANREDLTITVVKYPDFFPKIGQFRGPGCAWASDAEYGLGQKIQLALARAIEDGVEQANTEEGAGAVLAFVADPMTTGFKNADACAYAIKTALYDMNNTVGPLHPNAKGRMYEAESIRGARNWDAITEYPGYAPVGVSKADQTADLMPVINAGGVYINYGVVPKKFALAGATTS